MPFLLDKDYWKVQREEKIIQNKGSSGDLISIFSAIKKICAETTENQESKGKKNHTGVLLFHLLLMLVSVNTDT